MWRIHTESYGLDTQYGYVLATRIAALLMIISFRSRLFTTVSGIATRRRGGNPINLSGPRRLVAINIFAWIFPANTADDLFKWSARSIGN